jgi:hypothetical protein
LASVIGAIGDDRGPVPWQLPFGCGIPFVSTSRLSAMCSDTHPVVLAQPEHA